MYLSQYVNLYPLLASPKGRNPEGIFPLPLWGSLSADKGRLEGEKLRWLPTYAKASVDAVAMVTHKD